MSPGLDGDVLVVLAGTTRPLTGRGVAELTRIGSPDGVRKALDRLVGHGIVTREVVGRAQTHRLNREHLAAPAVEALAAMRGSLIQRLRSSISGWQVAPVHSSLFGSAARGDGDIESDIDIFLVRPRSVREDDPVWSDQVEDLVEAVQLWTGNRAEVFEIAEARASSLLRSRRPGVPGLRDDAIELAGASLSQVREAR